VEEWREATSNICHIKYGPATWRSASAFSLTTEGLGLVGRGEELVLDTTLSVSETALEGDRDLKSGFIKHYQHTSLTSHKGTRRKVVVPAHAMQHIKTAEV
jgi:hypothetical protein